MARIWPPADWLGPWRAAGRKCQARRQWAKLRRVGLCGLLLSLAAYGTLVVVAGVPAEEATHKTLIPSGTTVSVTPPSPPDVFIADADSNRVVEATAGGQLRPRSAAA